MAKLKLQADYDEIGKTLTVWFDDPQKEYICEETGDEVVLMKDKDGRVIGFERLNFVMEKKEPAKSRGTRGSGRVGKEMAERREKAGK